MKKRLLNTLPVPVNHEVSQYSCWDRLSSPALWECWLPYSHSLDSSLPAFVEMASHKAPASSLKIPSIDLQSSFSAGLSSSTLSPFSVLPQLRDSDSFPLSSLPWAVATRSPLNLIAQLSLMLPVSPGITVLLDVSILKLLFHIFYVSGFSGDFVRECWVRVL